METGRYISYTKGKRFIKKYIQKKKGRGRGPKKKKMVWKIRKIYIEEWKIFQWSNPFVYKNDSFLLVSPGVYWNIWINERNKNSKNLITQQQIILDSKWEPNIFVCFFYFIFLRHSRREVGWFFFFIWVYDWGVHTVHQSIGRQTYVIWVKGNISQVKAYVRTYTVM